MEQKVTIKLSQLPKQNDILVYNEHGELCPMNKEVYLNGIYITIQGLERRIKDLEKEIRIIKGE